MATHDKGKVQGSGLGSTTDDQEFLFFRVFPQGQWQTMACHWSSWKQINVRLSAPLISFQGGVLLRVMRKLRLDKAEVHCVTKLQLLTPVKFSFYQWIIQHTIILISCAMTPLMLGCTVRHLSGGAITPLGQLWTCRTSSQRMCARVIIKLVLLVHWQLIKVDS